MDATRLDLFCISNYSCLTIVATPKVVRYNSCSDTTLFPLISQIDNSLGGSSKEENNSAWSIMKLS